MIHIWVPNPHIEMPDDELIVMGEVVAYLRNIRTGREQVYTAKNIVTDAGDLYYAQRGVAATPTNFTSGATFDGIMELGTAGNAPGKASNRSDMTSPVASSQKAMDGTYPLVNDADGDNTGAGTDIITYRVSYTTAEANSAGIDRVIITNPTPGASEPVLMYSTITTFTKTSSDTLKMFVNHTMNGV